MSEHNWEKYTLSKGILAEVDEEISSILNDLCICRRCKTIIFGFEGKKFSQTKQLSCDAMVMKAALIGDEGRV